MRGPKSARGFVAAKLALPTLSRASSAATCHYALCIMYLLIIMNILWAGSYSFMKWGLEYLAPMHLLYARFLISGIILFFFSYKQLKGLDLRVVLRCAILGAVMATAHGLGMTGINKSYATDGAIIYALEPIVAIVYAGFLLKEKIDAWRIAALLLALFGFAVLSNMFSKNILVNFMLFGNFLMLLGIFVDGLFSPIAKPAVQKIPARVVITLGLFFAVIFLTPFAVTTKIKTTEISWQAVASILYLSVICTSVGWTLWVYFLKKFPVNIIALTVFLQPVFGPFISYFWLGEQISARVWFGGGIILTAVAIAVFKRKTSKEELIAEAVIR